MVRPACICDVDVGDDIIHVQCGRCSGLTKGRLHGDRRREGPGAASAQGEDSSVSLYLRCDVAVGDVDLDT